MGLAPNDSEARFYFGTQLAIFGEVEQAIDLTREALATEPLEANWYTGDTSHYALCAKKIP